MKKHTIGGNWFLLLLLAAPTYFSCGIHDSPPASSVMDFIFCWSDGSYVPFDTAHPSLLRSSSLSSPVYVVGYNLQNHSSDVFIVLPLDVSKPPQSCVHAPLCDILYFKGALYRIQILCRRYTFWSYPAGLTIADLPG